MYCTSFSCTVLHFHVLYVLHFMYCTSCTVFHVHVLYFMFMYFMYCTSCSCTVLYVHILYFMFMYCTSCTVLHVLYCTSCTAMTWKASARTRLCCIVNIADDMVTHGARTSASTTLTQFALGGNNRLIEKPVEV